MVDEKYEKVRVDSKISYIMTAVTHPDSTVWNTRRTQ